MSRLYHLAEKRNGQMVYNMEKLKHLISLLFEGKYLISFQRLEPKSTIKDYRSCYFAKLDALARDNGETRYWMHSMVKDEILSSMLEEMPTLFNGDELSTKYLTVEGWVVLLERLDIWAYTTYGTILE